MGNLGLLAWIFLAFFSVLFYNFLYGWLYLVLLAFIVYAVLRRLGCSSCYKCKACTSGFGRLSGAFFGKGFVKKESVGNRIGLVAFVYLLLLPIPVALLSISIVGACSHSLKCWCWFAFWQLQFTVLPLGSTVQQQIKNRDLGQVLNISPQTFIDIELVKMSRSLLKQKPIRSFNNCNFSAYHLRTPGSPASSCRTNRWILQQIVLVGL